MEPCKLYILTSVLQVRSLTSGTIVPYTLRPQTFMITAEQNSLEWVEHCSLIQ